VPQFEKSLILYPICFFETSDRKQQTGPAYRDLTHLRFVLLGLRSGIKIGEYLTELILLELKLVFVFQCFILVYWGWGEKTPKTTYGKKRCDF